MLAELPLLLAEAEQLQAERASRSPLGEKVVTVVRKKKVGIFLKEPDIQW